MITKDDIETFRPIDGEFIGDTEPVALEWSTGAVIAVGITATVVVAAIGMGIVVGVML